MISDKTIKYPCFFVIVMAFVLFFLQKYDVLSNDTDTVHFVLDIADFDVGKLYTRMLSSFSGMFYMLIGYKTAERIFGIKEGFFCAVMLGCSTGASLLFHDNGIIPLFTVTITGMTGVLIVLTIKPTMITHRTLWFFHLFFLLSCVINIIATLVTTGFFYFMAVNIEKKTLSPLKSLFNSYTVILCLFGIIIIKLVYFFLSDGDFIFALPAFNDIQQYFFALVAFFILFVPGIFFVLPSVPFLLALKKNSEFRILAGWTLLSWLIGAFTYGIYGCMLAMLPLTILISCTIVNHAMDIKAFFKSSVAILFFVTGIICTCFISASVKYGHASASGIVMIVCAFLSAYAAFTGGYAILRRRCRQSFYTFMWCYAFSEILLWLTI